MRIRWCTYKLKTSIITKYLDSIGKRFQYIGIAKDEDDRIERKELSINEIRKYPLVEWGITESEALQYCYDKGFDWEGLYEDFKRVSCWCCPYMSKQELGNLRTNFPVLWNELLRLSEKSPYPHPNQETIEYLREWLR